MNATAAVELFSNTVKKATSFSMI